jgi:hypothetical protein
LSFRDQISASTAIGPEFSWPRRSALMRQAASAVQWEREEHL